MAKQRQSAVPAVVMHLVKLRWQAKYRATPRRLLPANFRTKVKLLVRQPAEPHWQARSRATLRELLPASQLLLQALEIHRARVRARLCLRGPGPFAFCQEIPDAQKCNRAARC